MVDRAPTPPDDADAEPTLSWLDEIAEAEGLSREAAIEYLISSYWRLEEIVDLLEAGDGPLHEAASGGPAEPDEDLAGLHERFDTLLEGLRDREASSGDHEEMLSSILELGDRLERIESTLEGDVAGDELADLRERLAAVESTDDELSAVKAGLGDLEDRLDDLEAAAVDADRFESFADRTASHQQELSARQDALRSRVKDEFEHIRTVLLHLLEDPAVDGDAVRAVERALAELRSDREALAALTRAANRQGTRTADCGHCGSRVDIALLRSPTCPVCESRFTGLETAPRLLGLLDAHRLQVEPAEPD